MYLVDTNVWLERLLDQERSAAVGEFLSATPIDDLLVSDFSLHSIGIILDRLGRRAVFLQFIDDLFLEGGVDLVSVELEAMHRLVDVMDRFKLDFDDAYQYTAAERRDVVLVSFDADFDRTDRGRQTPEQILALDRAERS